VNWTQLLKSEIQTTYTVTARLLDKVDPDSLEWKSESGGNWMTVGQLVKNITNACGAPCQGFVTGDWGLPGRPACHSRWACIFYVWSSISTTTGANCSTT